MQENQNAHENKPRESGAEKKVYQKPAFRFERVFETQALSCGKIASTQPTCRGTSKKAS